MKKKTIRMLLFIFVLLFILWLFFRDSFFSVIDELSQTKVSTVVLICLCAVGYNLSEGGIFTCMARRYNQSFTYRRGVLCSYYTAFYRTVTLGSGTAAAAIYFLHKNNVELSCAAAISSLQYILHKLAVSLFSATGFMCCWAFMNQYFGQYKTALLAGYGLTIVICVFLAAICISEKFHKFLLKACRSFDKKDRFSNRFDSLEKQLTNLSRQTKCIFRDKKTLVFLLCLELLKLGFWYIIPYITLKPSATVFQTSAVTSLILTLAGIIPAPGGMGSTDGLYIIFFSKLSGQIAAASSIILYRFATYMLPCLAGGICVIILQKYWAEGD